MNYEEILNFAINIDLQTVDQTKKVVIKCYKDMIIEQIGEIFKMDKRIKHFEDKITEHLLGLDKCGVKFKVEKPSVKVEDDKQIRQGNEKSVTLPEALREPRLPGGNSPVQQVVS